MNLLIEIEIVFDFLIIRRYVMTMNYVNLTPHAINLNDGTSYPPSGTVVRVSSSYSDIVDGLATKVYGDIVGLPDPVANTRYIVSGLILDAVKGMGRFDVVAPATDHQDTVRNDKGHIVSVPCFVVNKI